MKRQLLVFLVSCGMGLSLAACKKRYDSASDPKEAPDDANLPSAPGIEGPFKWDQIKDATTGEVEHPWSDTYWPIVEKGISKRWNVYKEEMKLTDDPDTLYTQVSELMATEKAGGENLHYLSPGEKYDLLVSSTLKIPESLMAKMKEQHDYFEKNLAGKVKAINERMEAAKKEYYVSWDKYEALRLQQANLVSDYNKAMAEKNERLMQDIAKKMENLHKDIKVIAERLEKLSSDHEEQRKQRRELTKDFNRSQIDLAAELRKTMPMLGEAWQTWAGYDSSDIENLDWMGLCHGWAAAAIVEKKPQHAVMVNHDGKKILFTEGDIRGLLTKVWSEQAPDNAFFGARRCNATKLDYDEIGRVIDGAVCYGQESGECGKNNGKLIYVKNNKLDRGFVSFTEDILSKDIKLGVVEQALWDHNYKVKVFSSYQDFVDFQEKSIDRSKKAIIRVTTECRDTNPMTFHVALTKLLKEKKTGFVLDATRLSEVWNQPAYKYESKYLPIQLKKPGPDGKNISVPGEPVPVDMVDDPFKKYRAEGTAYLVHLQTKVWYGMENGPMLDYDRNSSQKDDANSSSTVTYTLELDKDKNLIGGEWGLLPFATKENETSTPATGDDPPDFLWYYPMGSKPKAGELNETIIGKIHNCNLAAPTGKAKVKEVIWEEKKQVPTIKFVEVDYADCKI